MTPTRVTAYRSAMHAASLVLRPTSPLTQVRKILLLIRKKGGLKAAS
jgi:hypothetical protein